MSILYCTTTDVEQYLPENMHLEDTTQPTFGAPSGDNISSSTVEFYIEEASRHIDASLSTQYDVPLKQTNVAGQIQYPVPVPQITAILAAQLIYEKEMQGADKQSSDTIKERFKFAMNMLKAIQNGERRLIGIRHTIGSRFVTDTLWNAPNNPVNSDKRSDGTT